jgi:rubrerythrin
MIKINIESIRELESSNSVDDLRFYLQKAIELEHSTIPPYLTAAFSIKENSNQDIKKAIMEISREEMLHFTIACNILIAVGGTPNIFSTDFIPNFPSTLPLSINNSLVVGLEKVSIKHIKDVFLEIEEPENPILFPLKRKSIVESLSNQEFATIGQFYELIKEKIKELDDNEFIINLEHQVVSANLFSPQHLFEIKTKEDALKAIDIIVEQGEGTTQLPIGKDVELAHYYKFKEIVVGRRLIRDDNSELGYSYSGNEISLNENEIYPLYPNMKVNDLVVGSPERAITDEFNTCYCTMLKSLQLGFQGDKQEVDNAYFSMFNMTEIATRLVKMPHPFKEGYHLSPTFEFITL